MFLPISVNNLRHNKKNTQNSNEIGKTVGGRKVFGEANFKG